MPEFHCLVDAEKPDVIVGTESWLFQDICDSKVFPPGYVAFRADGKSKTVRSGACVVPTGPWLWTIFLWSAGLLRENTPIMDNIFFSVLNNHWLLRNWCRYCWTVVSLLTVRMAKVYSPL